MSQQIRFLTKSNINENILFQLLIQVVGSYLPIDPLGTIENITPILAIYRTFHTDHLCKAYFVAQNVHFYCLFPKKDVVNFFVYGIFFFQKSKNRIGKYYVLVYLIMRFYVIHLSLKLQNVCVCACVNSVRGLERSELGGFHG